MPSTTVSNAAESRLAIVTDSMRARLRRIIVVGDLHGDTDSLASCLRCFDPDDDLIIFLGDYSDRGEHGVEVVERVAHLLFRYPDRVIALQGNHEYFTPDGDPRFSPCSLVEEAVAKWGSWPRFFSAVYRPFRNRLQVAALFPGELLFVHGGVSSRLVDANSLVHPSTELLDDILHSDCSRQTRGESFNDLRGRGVRFGSDLSATICERLGVRRIIRGHQHDLGRMQPGVSHEGHVVTVISSNVFSPRPYCLSLDATDPNRGDIVSLCSDHRTPIDYDELERASIRASLKELAWKGDPKLRQSVEALKRIVRGGQLRAAKSIDGPKVGLPKAEPECEYLRIDASAVTEMGKPPAMQVGVFLVLVHRGNRQVRDLYYCQRSPTIGNIHRLIL